LVLHSKNAMVKLLPVIYRCRNCGHVLFEFLVVGQDSYGLPTPSELIAKIGDTCPRCGNKLRISGLEDVKVYPFNRKTRTTWRGVNAPATVTLRPPSR
jgi:DNA-directed RNA polymerase subunit RPC12/RpoP